MRLGCPARVIHGFAAASRDDLQVIRYCVGDSEGAGTGFVAFLSPELGAPPIPRGLLSLPIAQHSDPVIVLEIVRGANPMFDITAVIGPSPREPCAGIDGHAGHMHCDRNRRRYSAWCRCGGDDRTD